MIAYTVYIAVVITVYTCRTYLSYRLRTVSRICVTDHTVYTVQTPLSRAVITGGSIRSENTKEKNSYSENSFGLWWITVGIWLAPFEQCLSSPRPPKISYAEKLQKHHILCCRPRCILGISVAFSGFFIDKIRISQYNICYTLINTQGVRMLFRALRAFIIGFVTVFAAKMLYYAVRDRGNK